MKHRTKAPEMPSLAQLESERRRCEHRSRYRRTLFSTTTVLAMVAAVSILVTMLWMPVYRIYGSSMAPTLASGQIVLSVKDNSFHKGDLVAFYYGNKLLIKRVIAGPEDMVDIKENGDVYINGTLLDEPYVSEKALGESDMEYPLQVPEEHWFLMGDHREVSVDSRSSEVGCVSQEQIAGRVLLRIWPLQKISIF